MVKVGSWEAKEEADESQGLYFFLSQTERVIEDGSVVKEGPKT